MPVSINSMQGLCYSPRCIQHLQKDFLFPRAVLARQFASKQTPNFSGFKAGKSTGSSGYSRHRGPGSNATGPSARSQKSSRQKSAKEASAEAAAEAPPKPRFRIGPVKLIVVSVAGYIGYKLYKWHQDPARIFMLNPPFFAPFILESRERVSSTSAILNLLSLPKGLNTTIVSEAWKKGVWSVDVMQPELQISRPYTPLPPTDGMEPEQLRLFVRQEPQGEVSSFLHKIYRGTIVNLRGPKIEYEIPENVDEILFLAGGTGIAPALQVVHTLFNHRIKSTEDGPELRILWANRRREDSIDGFDSSLDQQAQARPVPNSLKLTSKPSQNPLIEEVESLRARHGGKVIVDYLIDEEGSYITETLLRTYLGGIDQTVNQDGTPRTKIILVSGPEGFVDAFAGPKRWQGGEEIQGPLGGLLKKIDPQGWQIWKL